MFLYDKTNILEGSGIFEVDFAPSHGPANTTYMRPPATTFPTCTAAERRSTST